MNLLKMQIPAEYGAAYMVLAVSVGLATIGVCVFCAVYFGSRTFYFLLFSGGKNEKTFIDYLNRIYALLFRCLRRV